MPYDTNSYLMIHETMVYYGTCMQFHVHQSVHCTYRMSYDRIYLQNRYNVHIIL